MGNPIIQEYRELLNLQLQIRAELKTLPTGYISNKTIRGKKYPYLQNRVQGKIQSRYLKADDVEAVSQQLLVRKAYEEKLPQIAERMRQLEKAAALIGNNLDRQLMVYKLSAGMDDLSQEQKKRCTSFADAMTAIEGVPVSRETAEDLSAWENGKTSFQSVFEATLRRYGFPVEVS